MYLLYISKTKIEVFKNETKVSEVSWTKENLIDVLGRLKATFSSRFRVLLSDEFINITSLLASNRESKKRKAIQTKSQPLISQNLDQTVWDYKVVARVGKLKLVQITYLNQDFFNQFRGAVYSSKIKIKLIESLSTSICRFLPKNKLIFLVFQNLLVICFNQTPVYSKILDKKLSQGDIEEIFAYTKDRFKTLPQQIIFSPTGEIAFSTYDFSGLIPEYLDINPISGLINSNNISGPDESTTRLEIKDPSSIVTNRIFPIKQIVLLLIVSIIIVLSLIFGKQFLSSPKDFDQISPTISTTPTNIPTPIPTINFDLLKIQVLNGSGVAGEATKVSTLLSQSKFKVAKTGNASNYDFVKTEIKVKNSISSTITDLLIKSLESQYVSTISAVKLDDSDEYDIKITTGQPLKN